VIIDSGIDILIRGGLWGSRGRGSASFFGKGPGGPTRKAKRKQKTGARSTKRKEKRSGMVIEPRTADFKRQKFTTQLFGDEN